MQQNIESRLLMSAAVIAFAAAVWHLLCIWGGPSWFAFARAPEQLIASSKQGTLMAPLGAIVVAGLMFTCSAFALSALKILPKLPFTTVALFVIATVGIVRGLIAIPTFITEQGADTWQIVASSVWFYTGLCFFIGARQYRSTHKEYKTKMIVLSFYNEFREKFPDIALKTDQHYIKQWGELEPEFIYTWFECVASVVNNEMYNKSDAAVYTGLFEYLSSQFQFAGKEIREYIDVGVIENLFWQVTPINAAPYWQVLPNDLKTLYVNFHQQTPI